MSDTATETAAPSADAAPETATPAEAVAPETTEAAPPAAEAAAPEAEAPPTEKPPTTAELLVIAREKRALDRKRKEAEAAAAKREAELAARAQEVEAKQADIKRLQELAGRWEDDPQAVISALGVADPSEFFDAWTRKLLGEKPSPDDRVNKLEREMKRRDEAAKAEREAAKKAEEEAKQRAEEEAKKQQEEYFRHVFTESTKFAQTFIAGEAEKYPTLAWLGSVEPSAYEEVVNEAIAWQRQHGSQIELPKAAELVEQRLSKTAAERMRAMLSLPHLRAIAAEVIAPPAPAPAKAAKPAAEPAKEPSAQAPSPKPVITTIPVGRAAPTVVPDASRYDPVREQNERIARLMAMQVEDPTLP